MTEKYGHRDTERGRETDTTDRALRRGRDGRGASRRQDLRAAEGAWWFGAGLIGGVFGVFGGVSRVWFAARGGSWGQLPTSPP